MKKLIPKRILPILGILFVLISWKVITLLNLVNEVILPPPESVIRVLLLDLKNGNLLNHILISLFRVITGFSLAAVIGVTIGLLMGWFKFISDLLSSLIESLKSIPPIAWIPLAILWFGIGEISKIYIIAYGAFFPIVLNTIFGIKSIDKNLLRMAESMNLKGFKLFKEVIFPGALPSILTGLRIGLGIGWMCLIAAEMIGATSGLGYMIEKSRLLLLIPRVILGMITIGFLGFISDRLLQRLERKLIPWF